MKVNKEAVYQICKKKSQANTKAFLHRLYAQEAIDSNDYVKYMAERRKAAYYKGCASACEDVLNILRKD